MIVKVDEEDKQIAKETCNQIIDIITKIDRTDLRIYIMKMLLESFEEAHNCKIR